MTGSGWTAAGAAVALAAALAQLHGLTDLRRGEAGAGTAGVAAPSRQRVEAALTRAAPNRHLIAGLMAACAVWLVASPLKAVIAGLLAAAGSVVRARHARQARRGQREAAVPALARALADALRGGASVRAAFVAASDDHAVPAVLRERVRRDVAGLDVGAPLSVTLRSLAASGGASTRLLCGTIALHLDAGGALASELDRIAVAGEAGRRVEQDRQAATAQARATVRVVAALPLLAMAAAQLASPDFLGTLAASPVALALLLLGLILEAVAILAARAIVGQR